MDRFLKPFKILAIRARPISDIKPSVGPRVLYPIKHSCSCFKYYLNVPEIIISLSCHHCSNGKYF